MLDTILATKSHMKQTFSPQGRRLAVSVVKSGPNLVTQVKTGEKDGYIAVQLGFGARKVKNIKKPVLGHLRGVTKDEKIAPRFLREVRISYELLANSQQLKTGDVINPADVFKAGDLVTVTGISRGKGFAGVVKRWHFAGGPRTHGQSDRERAPGSIGQTTTPGRVFKGKKMAGRMGGAKTTVKNLTVIAVDDGGQVFLSGPVPGNRGSLLLIKKTGENPKWGEMPEAHAAALPKVEAEATPPEVKEEPSSAKASDSRRPEPMASDEGKENGDKKENK